MRRYDCVVIGSGPAGQKAAIQGAKLGKRVAVIEKTNVLGGATTIWPPDSSGTQISYVDASKVCGECSNTRLWLPPCQHGSSANFATLRCVTAMPFGIPVDPEVYIT